MNDEPAKQAKIELSYDAKKYRREVLDISYRCKHEVEDLRNFNSILNPKAEAYDLIKKIMDFIPSRGNVAASEDIVWRLRKRIEELEAEIKKEAE